MRELIQIYLSDDAEPNLFVLFFLNKNIIRQNQYII